MKPISTASVAAASAERRLVVPRRALSLFDATLIIVGIIIGAGIYETMPRVAAGAGSLGGLLGVWLIGGLLAIVGALCYAELACAYPEDGGDYVYLKRAFGPRMGFVFVWCELWIVRPGSIGAMAFVFARYANQLWPLEGAERASGIYAAGAILVLTGVNVLGVEAGKWTQNLLTAAKVLGLLGLFAVAFAGPAAPPPEAVAAAAAPPADFRFALILVLFTYGGWSEVAYVAAEVRNAKRNILVALLWGLGIVAAVYLLASLAFTHALGFDGLRQSGAAAADVLQRRWGPTGQWAICVLICLSTLGAINGQIFTGARIYYALGAEHPLFAWLGRWNARLGAPIWSLLVQCVATLAPIALFHVQLGDVAQGFEETSAGADGFSRLVEFSAPVYWLFFLLVGVALMRLADMDPERPRPFRAPAYPWTPLVFCAMSGWMLYASTAYAIEQRSLVGGVALAVVAMGIVVGALVKTNPTA